MQPEDSFALEQTSTCPYPEPDESNAHNPILFLWQLFWYPSPTYE
jgi:hypothetical protein